MMATPDSRELAVVFAGGAIGALCRGLLEQAYPAAASSWPWVIFAVNLGGAFLLGYFATRLQERLPLSSYRRPLLGTGLCGELATFSTIEHGVVTSELIPALAGSSDGLPLRPVAGSWVWLPVPPTTPSRGNPPRC